MLLKQDRRLAGKPCVTPRSRRGSIKGGSAHRLEVHIAVRILVFLAFLFALYAT